ncbi:ATPase [Candidatus Uhrbacteria bacterium RIFCSPLOWO2_01_FULL_47_24]|uniref:ATPase n=1 Tax=Candidatus Uhrbacteria bacterium RIFCSPLOWO2_01_FULL_47_24 TaxID=1802401 RepID=A0A1F7UUZ2_9BACT|nr:MAG: ATPase [Candidatus Uhrbacteria bacterium RIFCSPHIGHO2_01_FULL_47_11]OGL69340.1 MAG: ATPase [Candidatus Uhrbacteria bacterium RIFCSPHIGHO2_02_FULL_46_47]OGL75859.1 MAG: ATPase [Candidatus Uhrbacteria bacterium RIFCSPHIGHO2_12_FULL_47_11]OGL82076.1 MAG: ATPase [Candidatus Uhrbacteria bacterium RIFCSPLOWO2_01_FULL_47_24]OGL85471.1 MAG: ATPase [Candidatus Uhrbacteria bacterium RIFCSPLOWO2_02_FULL_46_25]OGL92619.1 MAG: ATPase [Candidatus Uhrbacteria bacterium RIFCSPLOWO2_12_FULL_47_10]
MYSRILKPPQNKSFFLFGPRGTGKTTWLKTQFPKALYFDLLNAETYNDLLARPHRLAQMIPESWKDYVVLDEVQRVPALLHEVHRLIENRHLLFALTGSSTRKLKRGEINLLAGRALTSYLYPLTTQELGNDFSMEHALRFGHLPSTFAEHDPKRYVEAYVTTYLREEVQQEGLTRNLAAFSRFLEVASFSQAQLLNLSAVARECAVHRKIVENYFSILEDLLIAARIPVFAKKAKRRMVAHQKFFFFDAGVFRALRPRGPLDTPEDIDGAALETLVFQEVRAMNHYNQYGYEIFFWRTAAGQEVDLILYGPKGIVAIEIKRSARITDEMFKGLNAFLQEYPMARAYFLTGGDRDGWEGKIRVMPVEQFLKNIPSFL